MAVATTATKSDTTPFSIYADADTSLPSTPNDIFPFPPDDNSVAPSIEQNSSPLSRRTSAITNTTSISSIPASLPPEKPYVLKRPRTVFRSPSTFPSRQMASPQSVDSPRSTTSQRYGTPRRRAAQDFESHFTDGTGTPRSIRSPSVLSNHSRTNSQAHRTDLSSVRSHSRGSTPSKSQAHLPLVLLHVTLLPPSHPHYSAQLLKKVGAPGYVGENQRLVEEKLSEMVRTRGILIPHPGEEYDLLEERLLESLELCASRVLGCGHFYGREDAQDIVLEEGSDTISERRFGSRERASVDSESTAGDEDSDVCPDCEQRMHLPGKGIGSGNKRFDIKIYAANGLMRAGAWAAAWKEMERVDVEIDVWMPEDVRRQLDQELLKAEEEEVQRREQEESMLSRADAEIEALSRANEEAMLAREEAEMARMKADDHAAQMQREVNRLLAAASTDSTPTPMPELNFTNKEVVNTRRSSSLDTGRRSTPPSDASLATLARKALILASQDPRNLALFGLSFLVLLLAFRIKSSPPNPSDPTTTPATAQLQTHHCAPYSLSIPTTTITNTILVTSTSTTALPPAHVLADQAEEFRQADSASSPSVSGARPSVQVHAAQVPPHSHDDFGASNANADAAAS